MHKTSWHELDAAANRGLTRFFNRTQWEPVYLEMPFDDLLRQEDDGHDGQVTDYEWNQRMVGVKAFFRFLVSRGVHPAGMLKQLAAAGRAMGISPFQDMTMGEIGLMYSETKAAYSWRCKVLSREIELSGMRGSKLAGQKSAEAVQTYRKIRKGNTNRKKGRGRRRPQPTVRHAPGYEQI